MKIAEICVNVNAPNIGVASAPISGRTISMQPGDQRAVRAGSHTEASTSKRWRSFTFFLALVVALGAFFAGIIVLSAVLVPSAVVPDASTRLKLQNDVRVTLLQSIGGMLVVVGAYFTWRQLQLGREQLRQNLDTSNAQLQLNRQAQTTEQLSRSIEQLGHDKAGVRVGAIFALEQIARNFADMRAGIHEVLATYIRAESTWSLHDANTLVAIEPDPGHGDLSERPLLKVRAPDIQAALTALGRRVEVTGEGVELQSTDLRVCYLGGAQLPGVFMGRAMLALSDLSGANLSGAWLRRTNFHRAIMVDCNLRKAVLRNAVLRGANLSNADLRGADMSDADLSRAVLEGARCDEATVWPGNFDWRSAGVTLAATAASSADRGT
jgi:hypothetical protein